MKTYNVLCIYACQSDFIYCMLFNLFEKTFQVLRTAFNSKISFNSSIFFFSIKKRNLNQVTIVKI